MPPTPTASMARRTPSLPTVGISAAKSSRTNSVSMGVPIPAHRADHRQQNITLDHGQETRPQHQMWRVRYHDSDQCQCLHCLDPGAARDQRPLDSSKQRLGSHRENHLPLFGRCPERLLHLPGAPRPHRQRPDQVCASVPVQCRHGLRFHFHRCKLETAKVAPEPSG